MKSPTRVRLVLAGFLLGASAAALQPNEAVAQAAEPSAGVKAVIEGTWRLIEWHVNGVAVEPPEMEGLWMVHDGWVMATRHRNAPDYESTAGYGEYTWGPNQWIYGYERSEDRRGPTDQDARLNITGSIPIRMRTYDISWEGDTMVLMDATGSGLRWEYDLPEDTFSLMMIDGPMIRKYRRVH